MFISVHNIFSVCTAHVLARDWSMRTRDLISKLEIHITDTHITNIHSEGVSRSYCEKHKPYCQPSVRATSFLGFRVQFLEKTYTNWGMKFLFHLLSGPHPYKSIGNMNKSSYCLEADSSVCYIHGKLFSFIQIIFIDLNNTIKVRIVNPIC